LFGLYSVSYYSLSVLESGLMQHISGRMTNESR